MKNVTVTLPEDLATRARVAAARENKSLSRYIADLLQQRLGQGSDQLTALEKFLNGPGYPGISKAWPGREALYAEREDELFRRYESARLRDRPARAKKTAAHGGFAEEAGRKPRARPKSTKTG
jgi:hypothetical protein